MTSLRHATISCCTDCHNMIGAVSGCLTITGCERCGITLASRSLTVPSCSDTCLYVLCNSGGSDGARVVHAKASPLRICCRNCARRDNNATGESSWRLPSAPPRLCCTTLSFAMTSLIFILLLAVRLLKYERLCCAVLRGCDPVWDSPVVVHSSARICRSDSRAPCACRQHPVTRCICRDCGRWWHAS